MSLWGFCKKVCRVCRVSVYHIPKKMFLVAETLRKDCPRILLISHELSLTGAPIVLFNIAKILKKNNFEVMVISYSRGKLAKSYEEIGVPVFIVDMIYADISGFVKLAKMFDLVIANTIVAYRAVWYIHNIVKYIWFIHEAKGFETELLPWYVIPKYNCPSVVEVLKDADTIYTVSEYARKTLSKYSDNVQVIYNGLEDEYTNLSDTKRTSNKLVFSFIALIGERKACDIFLKAITMLPEDYRNKVIFKIVGRLRDEYAKTLKKQYSNCAEWIGEVTDKNKIKEIYLETDLLVCVSRDDPAPLVVAEAAMFGVPSVISKNVGSTYLIQDGVSGFVVPTEDAKALCDVFMQIIDNPDILIPMKKKVRENYLKTSTMETFEHNFMKIVNDKLGINSEQ